MKNLLLFTILIIIIILLNNNVKEEFTKYGYQCNQCPWENSRRNGNTFDILDCKCEIGYYHNTTRWGELGGFAAFSREPLEGRCEKCPRGTYKDNDMYGGLEACTPCPPHKTTSATGEQNISSCKCKAGKTGEDGDAECSSCLLNTYKSIIGNSACIPIPDNAEAYPAWSKTFFRCLAGYYRNYDNNPNTCDEKVCNCSNGPNPTLSDCPRHSDSKCIRCNAGYELIDNQCIQCTSNKYKSTIDDSSCLDKPVGSTITQTQAGENIGFTCNLQQQYHLYQPTNICVLYNYLTYYKDSIDNEHLANMDETDGDSIVIDSSTRYELDTTNFDFYINGLNYGNNTKKIFWSINQELIFSDESNIEHARFSLGESSWRPLVKLVEFAVETRDHYSIKRFIVHHERQMLDNRNYDIKMEIRLVRTFRFQYIEIRVNRWEGQPDSNGNWSFRYRNTDDTTLWQEYYLYPRDGVFGEYWRRLIENLGSGTYGDCLVFRTNLLGVDKGGTTAWETGAIWQLYDNFYLNI